MLDTVILTIPMGKFQIQRPEYFQPHANYILNNNYYLKAFNNPRRPKCSEYFPRLTLYRRPSRISSAVELKIEFSAPKIIFQNNLDELDEDYFSRIIELLHLRIMAMGTDISHENLANASVSSFHPSKNIKLSGYWTATAVIKELNKLAIPKIFDLDNKDYNNGGHSLQYYTNSHSLVFYDKITDMGKPAKRSIDKEKTGLQTELFKKFEEVRREKSGNPIEILRMEVRLSKKRKMNNILQKLGYSTDPCFREVFNKELCQKILKEYWKELVLKQNLFLLSSNNNPQKILENTLKNNPSMQLKQAIHETGLIALAKDEEGMRGLRQVIESKFSTRTWYRTEKEIKAMSEDLTPSDCYEFVGDISKSIEEFRSFHYNNLIRFNNYLKT